MNKFIVWIVVSVVAAGGVIYFVTTSPATPEGEESPTPSVSESVAPSSTSTPSAQSGSSAAPTPTGTAEPSITPTPTSTVSVTPTPTPTPGLIVEETKIYHVILNNLQFTPQSLTVKQGDVIIFDNQGAFSDKIESLNNSFRISPTLRPGDSWQLETANLIPATYEYRLDTHTATRGTLIVE